jgi:DNA-binding response OmpR family regulator
LTVDPPLVLVVEDDDAIGSSLVRALGSQAYDVELARTGADAVTKFRPDTALVILDLGLPDVDGLEVCRKLRTLSPTVEILMLTARRSEVDVVLGLDAGADDYIIKPFRLAELLARVRARLRRADDDEATLVQVGDLSVDAGARRVLVGDIEIELRPREFDLLALLAANVGNVVRRDEIMRQVWDEHWWGSTKTLDIHIAALRRKLDRPGAPSRISTIRGVGYRLERP